MIDRVVKARIVHRVPTEQRNGARDEECQRCAVTTDDGRDVRVRVRVSDFWSSTFRWDVELVGSQPRDRRKICTLREL